MPTTVVNRKAGARFDVYVGRPSIYGNPYTLEELGGDRDWCLRKFEDYFFTRLETDDEFRRRVLQLRGKVLGCHCVPEKCHGEIIAAWVDAQPPAS